MKAKEIRCRVFQFFKDNYYILTSVLMFFSFPSYDVWFLKGFPLFAWISLVPIFHYVRKRGLKDVYFASFLTGLLGNYLTYEWIGNFGANMKGGYTVILVFLIPSLSVFFALKVFAAEFFSRKFEPLRYIIYPALWITVDWVESIGFLAFPWPYWGYSQYPFTPFVHLSSFTGIMGVTFVIIMFNCLFSGLLNRWEPGLGVRGIMKLREARGIATVAGFVIAVTIYGLVVMNMNCRPVKRDLRVAMIQSCISPWENWNLNNMHYLSESKRLTVESLKDDPDFIIWSESATLEYVSYDWTRGELNDFELDLLSFVQMTGRPLLTGEIGVVEELTDMFYRRYPQNNAVFINRYGEVVQSYSKIHLVPFGEWFPYEKWIPVIKSLTLKMGASSFVPGETPEVFDLLGSRFGVLICYEGIFHRFCREYKKMGTQFLINITNDGWTDTYRGHMQHFSASVFRAVENGLWYVRAGNTGYTAVIDPYGRIRGSIPILKKGHLAGDLDFSFNRETLYSKVGDLFLYLAMAFIAILSCIWILSVIRRRFGN